MNNILDEILKPLEQIKEVVKIQPTIKDTKQFESNSIEQIRFMESNSLKLVEMYNNGDTINGNEDFLKNDMKLENYRIEVKNGYINIVDNSFNFKYGYFSLGNKKLKSDQNVTYLIWNILQQVSCKYSTEVCRNKCYANKYPNNTYKNVIARGKNLLLTTFTNFEDIFNEVIELVNKIYGGTEIRIRIHESGDFYNKEYYRKIARVLNNNPRKNLALAYTKNVEVLPLLKDNEENFNCRYSIMSDTEKKYQELSLKHKCNYFICLDDIEKINHLPKCGGKCTNCNMCQNSNIKTIIVKTH